MKEESFLGLSPEGFHRVYYRTHGQYRPDAAFMCVHGLTRNSSDFDFLAQKLQSRHYVVCPDIVGRGRSDRLKNAENYSYRQYLSDVNTLIQKANTSSIDWLGTSMGGLLGLLLAAQPRTPIRRLILNDVGPVVPAAAIERLKAYAGVHFEFQNRNEAEAFLKVAYAPFGPMSPEAWQHFADNSLKATSHGTLTLNYDPMVAGAVEDDSQDNTGVSTDLEGNVTFWPLWDKITCPVFVVHGKHSDILTSEILEEMKSRGPQFESYEIEETGHAPSLTSESQVLPILEWIDKTQSLVTDD